MEINKQYLIELKASLEGQMQKALADANAARGALQLVEHHLVYLEKKVEEITK